MESEEKWRSSEHLWMTWEVRSGVGEDEQMRKHENDSKMKMNEIFWERQQKWNWRGMKSSKKEMEGEKIVSSLMKE